MILSIQETANKFLGLFANNDEGSLTRQSNQLDESISPDEQQRLVKRAEKFYKEQKNIRHALERVWYENILFYIGKHYVRFDFNMNSFVDYQATPDTDQDGKPIRNRIRTVINFPSADIQTLMGKISGDIIPTVKSISQVTEDIEEAETIQACLDYYWNYGTPDNRAFNVEFDIAKLWSQICGHSWIHPFWNDEIGTSIQDFEFNPGDESIIKRGTFRTGDIDIMTLSPFQLLVPLVSKISDAPAVIKLSLQHVDFVYSKYGVKVEPDNIQAVDVVNREMTSIDANSAFYGTTIFGNYNSNQNPYKDYCIIKEMWENPKSPDAKVITITGNKVLRVIPFPEDIYGVRKYPFICLKNVLVPGSEVGSRTQLSDGIPIIKTYERSKNQQMENQALTANPILCKHQGSSLNDEAATNEPGTVMEFVNTPPFWLNPPQMPVDTIARDNQTLLDYQSTMAINTSAMQKVSTYGQSLQLEEHDKSRLSMVTKNINDCLVETLRIIASMMRQNWDSDKIVPISDPMGDFNETPVDPKNWKMNSIIGVDGQKLLPKSRAAQSYRVLEAYKTGLLTDQEAALDMYGLGDFDKLFEGKRLNRKVAGNENKLMRRGVLVKDPAIFEDHSVHIRTHNKDAMFVKSMYLSGSMNPEEADAILNIFNMHIFNHYAMLQAEKQGAPLINPPLESDLESIAGAGGMMGGVPTEQSQQQPPLSSEGVDAQGQVEGNALYSVPAEQNNMINNSSQEQESQGQQQTQ